MKTLDQVMNAIRNGRQSECLDGRDYARLTAFFPVSFIEEITKTKIEEDHQQREWSEANILAQLKQDVEFGFEKALNKRGISSSLMFEVVKMWMWVLDDPLEKFEGYALYGLPLFKAVALKYGFENPIGDDIGDESQYDDGYYE